MFPQSLTLFQEAGPTPLCSALASSQRLPGATAPDTPALYAPNLLEVLGWRQAEGPFKGATISSVRPEPLNHSSPTPDSSQSQQLRGPERGGETAGRGQAGLGEGGTLP